MIGAVELSSAARKEEDEDWEGEGREREAAEVAIGCLVDVVGDFAMLSGSGGGGGVSGLAALKAALSSRTSVA